jgi:hypothetical protein
MTFSPNTFLEFLLISVACSQLAKTRLRLADYVDERQWRDHRNVINKKGDRKYVDCFLKKRVPLATLSDRRYDSSVFNRESTGVGIIMESIHYSGRCHFVANYEVGQTF